MAKRATAPPRDERPQLPPLSGIQQQVLAYVMNNVAFEHYDQCCSIEAMAEHFRRTPGHFKTTVQKLVDQGYLVIEGTTYPWVYPTAAALRSQDENLSAEQAAQVLQRLRRPRRKRPKS